jgi:hypothetical protein
MKKNFLKVSETFIWSAIKFTALSYFEVLISFMSQSLALSGGFINDSQ